MNSVGRARWIDSVDRRIDGLPISGRASTLIIAGLLILLVDSEALSLIPLLGVLADDYNLSATQAAWSVSVTAICTATFVPVMSRLGDIFGIRRILMVSLSLVVIGNVLTVIADGPALLLLGRGIVGLNAATTLLYVLLRLRSNDDRSVDASVGFMTAVIGGGVAVAFVLSGVIVQFGGSSRTVLQSMTALSVFVLVLGWLYIPDSKVRARVRIDYPGSMMMGIGLALLVIGIGQGNVWGWSSIPTLGVVVLGVVTLVAWVRWELWTKEPLIDLRIVARREVWPAFAASGVVAIIGNASAITISNFVRTSPEAGYGFGGSVLTAGLFLLPIGLSIACGGSLMQPVIARIGQRNAAGLGGVIGVCAFGWYAFNLDHRWQAVVVMVLVGISYSLTFTAAASAYMRGARAGEGGMLTGAGRIASTGISAFGPAVVTALLIASREGNSAVATSQGYFAVWLFLAACALLVVVFAALIRNSSVDSRLAPNSVLVADSEPETAPGMRAANIDVTQPGSRS